MASGEVLLNGTQLGTAGTSGNVLANLLDSNNLTDWGTSTPNGSWAGIDAGSPCVLTRVRLTAFGGYEDYVVGAKLQGSSSATFSGVGFVQGNVAHAAGSVS